MSTNENIGDMIENPKATLFKMAIPTFISFGCIPLFSKNIANSSSFM